MKALLVEGVFHWGFSVRMVSQSAAANPYLVPPPSTLIGALAYALALEKRLPECTKIVKGKSELLYSTSVLLYNAIPWATFAFTGRSCLTPYTDILRSFRLPYQRGERHAWEQKNMWFGVCGHGKMYACNAEFRALYLIKEEELRKLGLTVSDLARVAFSICRIGSRESIVSVRSVRLSQKLEVAKLPVGTLYYFPRRLVKLADLAEVTVTSLPKMKREALMLRPREPLLVHEHEEYVVPLLRGIALRPVKVEIHALSDEGVAVKAVFENSEEIFIAPREVIES